jgi:hypothetical protein
MNQQKIEKYSNSAYQQNKQVTHSKADSRARWSQQASKKEKSHNKPAFLKKKEGC